MWKPSATNLPFEDGWNPTHLLMALGLPHQILVNLGTSKLS
jgi:hypothetical protein